MKIAFSTLGCPNWTVDEMLDAARANGYDGVELRFYGGSLDLLKALDDFPGGPREFRRRFQRVGVEICCLDSSVVLSSSDTTIGEGEQMMELALTLGAPYVRVFGGDTPQGESPEECLKRAAEKLSRLGRRAAQRGLRVLVETHDEFSSGERLAALLAEAGETGVGALWDLFHPWRTGEEPAKTAEFIGGLTYHTHIKDGKRAGSQGLLGEGECPLPELLGELHKREYRGYVCFEWEKAWIPDLPGPEFAFPHAARYLTELFRGLEIPRG